ncbi:MAG TPA: hypothetical protein VFD35_10690 [Pricia sp.]|nr:hypothetical protein [Pricia sp.]
MKSNIRKIGILLLVFNLAYCHNPKNKGKTGNTPNENPQEVKATKTVPLQKGCYTYKNNGNIIILEITDAGETITANLMYFLKEKDRNKGTFKGRLKGDRLIGDYAFSSEGQKSIRQVVFLIKDGQLVEGYGEVETEGKVTYYKNVDALTYNYTMPLDKTACGQ